MSDELAEAMRQVANSNVEMAKVNAASLIQREQHSQREEASRDRGTRFHSVLNALNYAVRFNDKRSDRTAEQVLDDADKFLAWIEDRYHTPKADT